MQDSDGERSLWWTFQVSGWSYPSSYSCYWTDICCNNSMATHVLLGVVSHLRLKNIQNNYSRHRRGSKSLFNPVNQKHNSIKKRKEMQAWQLRLVQLRLDNLSRFQANLRHWAGSHTLFNPRLAPRLTSWNDKRLNKWTDQTHTIDTGCRYMILPFTIFKRIHSQFSHRHVWPPLA